MERSTHNRNKVFRYIAYLFLAGGAFVIFRHFTTPPPVDLASNKDLSLFIQNSILDIDQQLTKVDDTLDISSRVSLYKSNSALYNDAKNNKDKVIAEKSKVLKDRIVKIQTKELPILREEYVSSKKEILAQQQIDISLSGEKKEVLTFTGNVFEPKKNKKKFLDDIHDIASDLRFKEVIFKWSGENDDFSSYKLHSKTDTEI